MLDWASQAGIFCFLDNHQFPGGSPSFECLLAVGAKRKYSSSTGLALAGLQQFINEKPAWLFGHLGYDLKNEIEALTSSHQDPIQFPVLHFFEPEILFRLAPTELIIDPPEQAENIFRQVMEQKEIKKKKQDLTAFPLQQRLTREEYLHTVKILKEHIHRGDCYEINFCQEFFANPVTVDPCLLYQRFSQLSPSPFSAYYKLMDRFLICASPERFLKKVGHYIMSQPMKGTAPRYLQDPQNDRASRQALYQSVKERTENVIVVDLVRNDLSRICEEGSVRVEELFGIYSFLQVHQMISTVGGRLRADTNFTDIVRATFPMGSMTGAPKKRVMELIDQYERVSRGIYSGALGYITPDGDFDFNVVIRSMMYNATEKYFSFLAGSGITFYSHPEQEYEECLWKAQAMKKSVLN